MNNYGIIIINVPLCMIIDKKKNKNIFLDIHKRRIVIIIQLYYINNYRSPLQLNFNKINAEHAIIV